MKLANTLLILVLAFLATTGHSAPVPQSAETMATTQSAARSFLGRAWKFAKSPAFIASSTMGSVAGMMLTAKQKSKDSDPQVAEKLDKIYNNPNPVPPIKLDYNYQFSEQLKIKPGVDDDYTGKAKKLASQLQGKYSR